MNKPWNRWLGWTVVLVVAADWLTKFWILNRVAYYESIHVIEGWLSFVHLKNRGVAFSILNDSDAVWRTPLLIAVAAIVLVILARVARTIDDNRVRFGIALVAGGALGNLGDRLANGAVTDFISVAYFPYVFNIADAAICIGGAVLALTLGRAPAQKAA